MSGSHLPPEIPDHIIDLLHGERKTLKECCLISKSWVPRARSHLFSEVAFNSRDGLRAWEKSFPSPIDSPARYIRSLSISRASSNLKAVAKWSGWVQVLSNVVQLKVWNSAGLLVFLT